MDDSRSNMRRAFIVGITGQDGSYLTELLLSKGYRVFGIIRRSSSFNTARIDHLLLDRHEATARVHLFFGDLTDGSSLQRALEQAAPDEIYNLGAQSHVRVSFDIPEYTGEVTALGTARLLEAMRRVCPSARYYQASSSELFGNAKEVPQRESTPFHPRSPYAAAKAFAFYMTQNYREAYSLFAVNGILFNHESERRGETFVSRKITRAVGRIKHGLQKDLFLGNLEARRDWGHAADYVKAMWLMLQQEHAEDFVIGTGESHSVREFVELAFGLAGLEWEAYVKIDPTYYRPAEVDHLLADASHAKRTLGWSPEIDFRTLVQRMVSADLELAARERRMSA
jgi:GDPmannose 4,6-dehydratase